MRLKSGERTFVVNKAVTDHRGYFETRDVDTLVTFYLPEVALASMVRVINWDYFETENFPHEFRPAIERELERLNNRPSTPNIERGKEHMRNFLRNM